MNENDTENKQHKFGTFAGVFIPSILTIFGPIMFLRFGYVIGNVGIWQTLLILILAQVITLSTGFSLAAISTNTPVLEGGAYYLISRSLGAGFGGAIGLTLFLAQSLSVPFYIIGFTEALIGTFPFLQFLYFFIVLITGVILFLLVWSGANWAIKTQVFIFVLLLLAILAFLWGAGINMNVETMAQNKTGINNANFFAMFAIFFPAVTGIMAGVNMSGELKNPGGSLAKGTFAAIIFATVVYGIEIFVCGGAFSKEILINHPYTSLVENAIFGLGFLVVVGVLSATISSAIGSFLGAPRVLRALSRDLILPGLKFFTKEKNKKNEPRKALFATLIITLIALSWAGIQAGKIDGNDPLNVIAKIVSMFFLYTYGMINLAAFVESFGDNPSFRPRFKYFHWSIALFGAVSSIAVSFLVDYQASIIALLLLTVLFFIARKRELKQSFGDARRGFVYSRIRNNLIRLQDMPFNPKNWRPTIAVLVGNINSSSSRLPMLKYAIKFEGGKGIISLVEFITGDFNQLKDIRASEVERLKRFVKENDFRSVFPEVIVTGDFDTGLSNFLQTHSIGPVKPNIIMMGCPKDASRFEPFIRHLKMIAYLEKSFIVYKEPNDYNAEDTEYPRGKYIDIWWRGQQNGSLMLILAHILQSNPIWKDTTAIRIIRIVEKEPGMKSAEQDLNIMINASRIDAEAKVIVSANLKKTLHHVSKNSAAVFLGTIIPEIKEITPFFDRINYLLEDMPSTFLIHSSGDADLLA
jgi:solute carrier family 12 (sodium/potassium/chloride transporter), member 2